MKHRPQGFLSESNISHDSEIFDYVEELHSYIWRFIRVARPGVSGDISKLIDDVIESLEAAQQSAQVDIPCPYCHSKTPGIHNPNCQYIEFFNSPRH